MSSREWAQNTNTLWRWAHLVFNIMWCLINTLVKLHKSLVLICSETRRVFNQDCLKPERLKRRGQRLWRCVRRIKYPNVPESSSAHGRYSDLNIHSSSPSCTLSKKWQTNVFPLQKVAWLPFFSFLCYSLLTMYCFCCVGFSVQRNYNVWHDEVTVAGAHFQFWVGEAA